MSVPDGIRGATNLHPDATCQLQEPILRSEVNVGTRGRRLYVRNQGHRIEDVLQAAGEAIRRRSESRRQRVEPKAGGGQLILQKVQGVPRGHRRRWEALRRRNGGPGHGGDAGGQRRSRMER